MADVPRFLRFDRIDLLCYPGWRSVARRRQIFLNHLRSLKEALKDSLLIHLECAVDRNSYIGFKEYSSLFNHIRNELLPICVSSRRYKLAINLGPNRNAQNSTLSHEHDNHITLLNYLSYPQVTRCRNVSFYFYLCEVNTTLNGRQIAGLHNGIIRDYLTGLPIEAISTWLNQKLDDGIKINGHKQPGTHEQSLQLDVILSKAYVSQLCANLKKVNLFIFCVNQIKIV